MPLRGLERPCLVIQAAGFMVWEGCGRTDSKTANKPQHAISARPRRQLRAHMVCWGPWLSGKLGCRGSRFLPTSRALGSTCPGRSCCLNRRPLDRRPAPSYNAALAPPCLVPLAPGLLFDKRSMNWPSGGMHKLKALEIRCGSLGTLVPAVI